MKVWPQNSLSVNEKMVCSCCLQYSFMKVNDNIGMNILTIKTMKCSKGTKHIKVHMVDLVVRNIIIVLWTLI